MINLQFVVFVWAFVMNRKTIIYCSLVVAVLLLATVICFSFLFSDEGGRSGHSRDRKNLPVSLEAVPSDAVMVLEFDDYARGAEAFSRQSMPPYVFSGKSAVPKVLRELPEKLEEVSGSRALDGLLRGDLSLSLHYSGHNRISPLVAITPADSSIVRQVAEAVSDISGDCIVRTEGGTVVFTDSEVMAESSLRHLSEGVSILDNPDFESMALSADRGTNLYVNHRNLGKLFSGCFNSGYLGYASFFQNFSYWSCYSLEETGENGMDISGFDMHNVAVDEYSYVFNDLRPKSPTVFSVTPYYSSMVLSLPVSDLTALVSNIDRYRDGQGRLDKMVDRRQELARKAGISPEEWASSLSIGEVAVIRFDTGGKETFVNMVKCGNLSAAGDTAVMKKYDYPGFLASLFGSVFSLAEEDYCVSVSGWLAIGPESAMRDFLNGSALELDLARYLSDAGLSDAFPSKSLLTVYLNVASDPDGLTSPFKTSLARSIAEGAAGHTVDMYAYSLVSGKNGAVPSLKVRLSDYEVPTVSRFDRDTVVVIPKGPWKVKNCGTGRTNLMYQQDNMYICLTEENGKGIWSAPFSSPICGNIDQLDYFENGKLQMIFASGSKLYVIDRLGRMVRPFPVDLGKEILLGPQVYDFNQNRKYNVMVLHTDNTLGLYDLKGRLRDDWVGFDTDETIKKLPRLMEINSSLYWVVTTSLQTVICDFTGKPVADFSGSKKMRPDVRIEPYAGNSVEIETYDGKMWVLDLKSGEFSRR